jgi:FHA domain/Zinc-ribbon containing domain
MEAFRSGTLAGAGSFRCESCGFAVTLHERDEMPDCPHCEGGKFRRSSIFGENHTSDPVGFQDLQAPEWLGEARDALVAEGDYIAWEDDDRVRVVPLQDGWTRLGRSLAAHMRFDDPTVSRRHALIHRQEAEAPRVLDDRSLNGVFLNGERVEWHELEDGDEIVIGRFHLYFMSLAGKAGSGRRGDVGTAVG